MLHWIQGLIQRIGTIEWFPKEALGNIVRARLVLIARTSCPLSDWRCVRRDYYRFALICLASSKAFIIRCLVLGSLGSMFFGCIYNPVGRIMASGSRKSIVVPLHRSIDAYRPLSHLWTFTYAPPALSARFCCVAPLRHPCWQPFVATLPWLISLRMPSYIILVFVSVWPSGYVCS